MMDKETQDTLPGNLESVLVRTDSLEKRRTTRRKVLRYGAAVTGGLVAAAYVKPDLKSISIPRAFASTSPQPPRTGGPPCPTIDRLNFEYYPHNGGMVPLTAGTIITNQFADWGIHIEARSKSYPYPLTPGYPAMIFDTANPTGGDPDLGTPNQAYGGPGQGSGANAGKDNTQPRHKVLIISEDGNASDPDDKASGGMLLFNFNPVVAVSYVGLLDMDDNPSVSAIIYVHQPGGWTSINVPTKGDNSYQAVPVGEKDIDKLAVLFKSSGAVSEIAFFCPH